MNSVTDVGIKSSPFFPNVAQKVFAAVFSLKGMFFRIAQKMPNICSIFERSYKWQDASKIAQSVVVNLAKVILCNLRECYWLGRTLHREMGGGEGRPHSVTWLGDFYKFLVANCLTKVSQIFWRLFGQFLVLSLLSKKCVATFWAFLQEIRQLFKASSSHTVATAQLILLRLSSIGSQVPQILYYICHCIEKRAKINKNMPGVVHNFFKCSEYDSSRKWPASVTRLGEILPLWKILQSLW